MTGTGSDYLPADWAHSAPQPPLGFNADAAQQDEAEETTVGLIVAGGNTAKVLQLVNKALDAGA